MFDLVELLRRYSKLPILGISARIARSERRKPTKPSPPRSVRRRLSHEAVAQLCTDYQAGATTRELAATYDISKTSVQRLLKEHEVTLRHQGLTPDQLRDATGLYQAGKSVAQVARTLGLSPSSVYDALKQSGVQLRPAHEQGR